MGPEPSSSLQNLDLVSSLAESMTGKNDMGFYGQVRTGAGQLTPGEELSPEVMRGEKI